MKFYYIVLIALMAWVQAQAAGDGPGFVRGYDVTWETLGTNENEVEVWKEN